MILTDSTRPGREPPRWWTLLVPCLLTLPVSALCVLIAALSGLFGCFDTCMVSNDLITPIGVTEFMLALAAVVTLVVGLALPTWRRAMRWVLWIACVLAWLGGGYVFAWASTRP